ncbi:hypothetical protein CISG_01956 [Coccidioides immitis RMSCC 3703]|uniref:Uncharacterized protein n=1 Tax=Coccidioides immitis RMSCC 3703 TaxID=454286 RepID=A0A0J8R720_COCIT|nr:hypothetical protein CISG_01956 [Coccidioides immitis RMSCC 3703]
MSSPFKTWRDSSLAAMTRDGPVKHSLPTGEVSTDTGQPQDTDKSPQSVPAKPPTIENKAQPARTGGTRGSDKDDQTSRPPQAENDSHNACQRQNSHLNPTDRYRPNPAPLPTSTSTKPHSTQPPPPPPPPPPKSQPHMSIPPSIPQAERTTSNTPPATSKTPPPSPSPHHLLHSPQRLPPPATGTGPNTNQPHGRQIRLLCIGLSGPRPVAVSGDVCGNVAGFARGA